MNKREFEEMVTRLYAAYTNIVKKMGHEPVEFRQFKVRFKMWKEW